jgi:hypothetical protein
MFGGRTMSVYFFRSEPGAAELRRLARRESGRVCHRVLMIANMLEGMEHKEAARLAGLSRSAAYEWHNSPSGSGGVTPRPRCRRCKRIAELKVRIHSPPALRRGVCKLSVPRALRLRWRSIAFAGVMPASAEKVRVKWRGLIPARTVKRSIGSRSLSRSRAQASTGENRLQRKFEASARHRRPQQLSLLDHLIGEIDHAGRNGQAQRLGGLEVDEQQEFRRLLDRQVGRLGAFQDLIDIIRSAPE